MICFHILLLCNSHSNLPISLSNLILNFSLENFQPCGVSFCIINLPWWFSFKKLYFLSLKYTFYTFSYCHSSMFVFQLKSNDFGDTSSNCLLSFLWINDLKVYMCHWTLNNYSLWLHLPKHCLSIFSPLYLYDKIVLILKMWFIKKLLVYFKYHFSFVINGRNNTET